MKYKIPRCSVHEKNKKQNQQGQAGMWFAGIF